jgi:DNA-binding NarL/FixJ family response regulator
MGVVVADDSVLPREGVARLLEDAGVDVVGPADDADQLMRTVLAYKPHAAIMPPTSTDDGFRAALEIKQRLPGAGVLILPQYVETGYALELISDSPGRVGYLLKDRVADIDGLVDAARRVAEGGSVIDPEVVAPSRQTPTTPRPIGRPEAARAGGATNSWPRDVLTTELPNSSW